MEEKKSQRKLPGSEQGFYYSVLWVNQEADCRGVWVSEPISSFIFIHWFQSGQQGARRLAGVECLSHETTEHCYSLFQHPLNDSWLVCSDAALGAEQLCLLHLWIFWKVPSSSAEGKCQGYQVRNLQSIILWWTPKLLFLRKVHYSFNEHWGGR